MEKYLENKIKSCDELGGMEKEKWAFTQCLKHYRENSNQVQVKVNTIFTEEEHNRWFLRILRLLLASKIAEIQAHIVYDEPTEQRMGKVNLINILNDIYKKTNSLDVQIKTKENEK